MSAPNSSGYAGQRDLTSGNSWENAIDFAIRMFMGGVATAKVVRVVAVYPAAENALAGLVGFVDVLPLVNGVDGQGNVTAHDTVHGIPYFRAQGGASAVILDPEIGDIGMAAFTDRDISAVKRVRDQANPGSARRFDMADGMYFGGFLNGSPTQFVEFLPNAGGIKITTPQKLVINSANCTLDANGNLAVSGNVTWDKDGTATDARGHKHDNVTNGPNQTNPPVPGT